MKPKHELATAQKVSICLKQGVVEDMEQDKDRLPWTVEHAKTG
jgi:hypothetical protein